MAATENHFSHGFFGEGAEVQGTVVRVTVGGGKMSKRVKQVGDGERGEQVMGSQ